MQSTHRPLRPASRKLLEKALLQIESGETAAAEAHLVVALAERPGHPELLHGLGALQLRRGYVDLAVVTLEEARLALPKSISLLVCLANALARSSRFHDALAVLEVASVHAQDLQELLLTGVAADQLGSHELALRLAEQVLALDRRNAQALLLRARSAQILGRIDDAARDYRAAAAQPLVAAKAWFALADLKTVSIEAAELAAIERASKREGIGLEDRTMLTFALARGLEDSGDYARAFECFGRANELARMQRSWNATEFSAQAEEIAAAFRGAVTTASPERGREVIFVVGMPRSGTTLVEQVLAAHSRVEGASELPYLNTIIAAESRRLRQPFPRWVAAATSDDWQRMGGEYLRLSARWRAERPVSTDKLPENWLLAGAVLSMLPAARVIDCRRDAVETCWSCYKQLFAMGRVGFAYDFGTLAAYWHDHVRLGRLWADKFPERYRIQSYEEFVADPEAQTRALLRFCRLEFEAACLRFHEAQRGVRSASAAQVRQPLQPRTARAMAYGEMLEPLVRSLRQVPTDSILTYRY